MDTHIAAPPELDEHDARVSQRHPGLADRDVSRPADAGPSEAAADTCIAAPLELEDRGLPRSARLPGEPDPDAPPAPHTVSPEQLAISSRGAQPKGKRRVLLGGTAVVAVVVLAGSAFLLSPYNHVVPVPADVAAAVHQAAKRAGVDTDRPLAPSASLAGIDLPSRPAAVVLPPYTPEPRDQDLAEVLAARPNSAASGTSSTPQAAAAKPTMTEHPAHAAPAFVPHEPGSVMTSGSATANTSPPLTSEAATAPIQPHPAARDITKAVVAAAGPEVAPPQPKPVAEQAAPPAEQQEAHKPDAARPTGKPAPGDVVPASAPPDAVSQALHLQAGPMSNGDQIQVLELVTKIAKMVSDLKSQSDALRTDFAKATADSQARLADFARRIDLAEAIKAVGAAERPGDPAASSAPVATDPLSVRPATTMAPIAVTRPDVALPSTAPQDAKRYRVQAASPGLALLTEIARGGGDGAQIQVTVGDTIPGWGKVKSVSQRGTSWVVSTDKGVID